MEERLNDTMEQIIVALWKTKSWRVVKEKEEEDRWTRLQEKHRREEEFAAENKRREELFKDVEMWRRSADLRVYVKAVQQSAADGRIDLNEQDLTAWKIWALKAADDTDPLVGGKVFSSKTMGGGDDDNADSCEEGE